MDKIQRNETELLNSNNFLFQIAATSEEIQTKTNLNNDKCNIVSNSTLISSSETKTKNINNNSFKECDRTTKSKHSFTNVDSSSNIETFLCLYNNNNNSDKHFILQKIYHKYAYNSLFVFSNHNKYHEVVEE